MDLGEGLRKAMARLTGAVIIDARTIKEFNKELQKALLSADVDVNLAFLLTQRIESAALKEKLPAGVSAKDYITNMVYNELVRMMGGSYTPDIRPKRILMLGLYGSGKTTTAAKLAKFYQDRGMSSALIACDVSRPAAYEQLQTLAQQAGVAFYGRKGETDAAKVVREALVELKGKKVLICDTSGRNALDEGLIDELKAVDEEFKPDERFLVINADTGQVAGKQAKEFDSAVKITGVIVTKLDGSGRGGGALSAVNSAQSRVTFVGTGEKLDALELYDSRKFVGRLLGMPDIDSLITKVQDAIKDANIKPEEAMGENLDFGTFYSQLKAMSKMGSMKSVMGMLGLADMPAGMAEQSEDKLKKYKAMIDSMTKEERKDDKLLGDAGRVRRIAKGSGVAEKDVKALLTDFARIKKMYNAFKNDRNMRKQLSRFMQ